MFHLVPLGCVEVFVLLTNLTEALVAEFNQILISVFQCLGLVFPIWNTAAVK